MKLPDPKALMFQCFTSVAEKKLTRNKALLKALSATASEVLGVPVEFRQVVGFTAEAGAITPVKKDTDES